MKTTATAAIAAFAILTSSTALGQGPQQVLFPRNLGGESGCAHELAGFDGSLNGACVPESTCIDINAATGVALESTCAQNQTWSGSWDATSSGSTKPCETATTKPGSCTKGECFIDEDDAAFWICDDTPDWVLVGGGGGATEEIVDHVFNFGQFAGLSGAGAFTFTYDVPGPITNSIVQWALFRGTTVYPSSMNDQFTTYATSYNFGGTCSGTNGIDVYDLTNTNQLFSITWAGAAAAAIRLDATAASLPAGDAVIQIRLTAAINCGLSLSAASWTRNK